MKYYFITGAGGFVGSNLATHLVKDKNNYVFGYDNFSTGKFKFIKELTKESNFNYINADIHDYDVLESVMGCPDVVFHLAANADVRRGFDHPYKDFDQNILSTFYVLEAMRNNGARHIAFTSTGSVYGANPPFPTPEDCPIPIQNSLYGASKMACEGMIQAYCEGYNMQSHIFRLVSVMGKNYQHGCLFDFYRSILRNPNQLNVLGDGFLQKSYINIQDCIDGLMTGLEHAKDQINILNVAPYETCNVRDIVGWMCAYLNIRPEVSFGKEFHGWKGDNPISLDSNRLQKLGWKPRFTIRESVEQTLEFFLQNQWLFEEKK